ncbi:MAG: hypothetical protein ACRC42_03150, partial [Mycoplasma sp.]
SAIPQQLAKIGKLEQTVDNKSTMDLYSKLEQRLYDIIGVPMATSNTGQGVVKHKYMVVAGKIHKP